MRVPLVVLSSAVLGLGLLPTLLVQPLEVVAPGAKALVAPFLGAIALPVQLAAIGSALLLLALVAATRRSPRAVTWDCGYAGDRSASGLASD